MLEGHRPIRNHVVLNSQHHLGCVSKTSGMGDCQIGTSSILGQGDVVLDVHRIVVRRNFTAHPCVGVRPVSRTGRFKCIRPVVADRRSDRRSTGGSQVVVGVAVLSRLPLGNNAFEFCSLGFAQAGNVVGLPPSKEGGKEEQGCKKCSHDKNLMGFCIALRGFVEKGYNSKRLAYFCHATPLP